MKAKNKVLIIIVVAWFLCLCVTYIGTTLLFINDFLFLSLTLTLFAMVILAAIYINLFLDKQIPNDNILQFEHYDNLTELPKRVLFNEILNKTLRDAQRHSKLVALIFIDIDHFKKVNEKFGRKNADLILKEIGKRFLNILRAGDVLARSGGDEFTVLLNDISHPKFAGTVAEKLLKVCSQPILVKQDVCHVTASIGISIFPNDGISIEDLQKNTDIAMYKAKFAGGAAYQYFTNEMNVIAQEYVKLEAFLRQAIEEEKFTLHYQPQLNIKNGIVKRVETLIRLNHPEFGLISPNKFIPLAEEIGLILPIGEWILFEACKTCKQWHNEGYSQIMVAVNISPKQFYLQDIAAIVAHALKASKLEAKFLQIEITETAIMQEVEIVVDKIQQLRAMNVKVSIDDFGTGYTSINYLKQFPVTGLKIDQSLIKGIPDNPNDVAITNAIIALSHHLGFEVVAEGVETAEQMQHLANQGCDFIQGYFFSKPLPASKIVNFFTKKNRT